MKKVGWFVFGVVLVLLVLVIGDQVSYYVVEHGAEQQINEHGESVDVTNNCGMSIFVPTNTEDEFFSFTAATNLPSCITAGAGGGPQCTTKNDCKMIYVFCDFPDDLLCLDGSCCTNNISEPVSGCPAPCPSVDECETNSDCESLYGRCDGVVLCSDGLCCFDFSQGGNWDEELCPDVGCVSPPECVIHDDCVRVYGDCPVRMFCEEDECCSAEPGPTGCPPMC